ncbi:MAG: PAS domain S-box protein [Deltaproteobacteria bacterium]|nr:PAS domain S-box protein [Deltaproteobacteria bacterium]
MDSPYILTVLYDLALVMGGETGSRPLVNRFLQRLMYHTALPSGLFFSWEGKPSSHRARMETALGDPLLAVLAGHSISVPAGFPPAQAGVVGHPQWLSSLLGEGHPYTFFLAVPVPQQGFFLLLSPSPLPVDPVLGPAMAPLLGNFSRALELCRTHDEATQRLLAEREHARFLSARFAQALDAAPDAIFLFQFHPPRVMEFNAATVDMTGYAPEDLALCPPGDLLPDLGEDFWLEHHASVGPGQPVNTRLKRKDGVLIPVELTMTQTLGEDGTRTGVVVARDISRRDAAENQARLLSLALDQANEAVAITDRKGLVHYVNMAFTRVTGYSAGEVSGQPLAMLQEKELHSQYEEIRAVLEQGIPWQGRVQVRRKMGDTYPARVSFAPVADAPTQGGLESAQHFVVIHEDLSEVERLEERFRQAQKMEAVGTLAGGVAHDFNNMLTGIKGNLQLAMERTAGNDAAQKNLERIARISERAAQLVQQLLVFARKRPARMERVSFHALVNETMGLFQASLPSSIGLRLDLPSDAMLITGDFLQLQQLMVNLIHNARDALENRDDPIIHVRARRLTPHGEFFARHPKARRGPLVCLTVSDNGAGVEPQLLDKIFDPFFSTKEVGRGTGLGLAMVYGAVQAHQGAVEVESKHGQGTAFHVYLPLLEEDSNQNQV